MAVPLSDDELWAAWCSDFDEVTSELHALFHTRWMWRTITKLMESVEQYVVVQNYFVRTYVGTMASAIRRETDKDPGSTSLARCLQALVDCPHIASRERYIASVQEHLTQVESDERVSAQGFDLFAPGGDAFADPQVVVADLERLHQAAAPVKRYTNKVIAHRDSAARTAKPPMTFPQINVALDELGAITRKYYRLRHPATELAAMTPAVDLTFLRMFEQPWYQAGFEPPDTWEAITDDGDSGSAPVA